MYRNAAWPVQSSHSLLVLCTHRTPYIWEAVQYAMWAVLRVFCLVYRNVLAVALMDLVAVWCTFRVERRIREGNKLQQLSLIPTLLGGFCLSPTSEQFPREIGLWKEKIHGMFLHDWSTNACIRIAAAPRKCIVLVLKCFPLSFSSLFTPNYLVSCHALWQFPFSLPLEPPLQQPKNRLVMS